ncbi:MAG: hypothetical protein ACRED1_02080 [Limisphaerales bacterium]
MKRKSDTRSIIAPAPRPGISLLARNNRRGCEILSAELVLGVFLRTADGCLAATASSQLPPLNSKLIVFV